MKILFISPVGALFSGAEISIVHLMSHLVKQGYEVHNVIPDLSPTPDLAYLNAMEKNGIKLHQLKTINWWWEGAPYVFTGNNGAMKAYQYQNVAEVRNIIRENNIELVVSNTVNVFQGAIAAAFEKVPHYYIVHEFPFGEFEYYKYKIGIIDNLSDKIFAVEGELYKTLLDYFPEDKLVPFIPYTDVKQEELSPGENIRLLSLGGINERKNQLELIKAYHSLNLNHLELIFIGGWDEDYKRLCDDYILKNKIQNIQFLGYQENPWQYVTNKDILILPSKIETFGLVFVEAILNGVPAIVSDNLGHFSVEKSFHTGTFYPLGHIEKLTEKISYAIEHFETLKAEAKSKKVEAQKIYQIENVSKIFLDSFKDIEYLYEKKDLSQLGDFFDVTFPPQLLEGWKKDYLILELKSGTEVITQKLDLSDAKDETLDVSNYEKMKIQVPKAISFERLELINPETNNQLEEVACQDILKNHLTSFLSNDSYIEFNVAGIEEICLSYKKANNDNLFEMIGQLQGKLATSEKEKEDFAHRYHSVVHSRRWTIPTRIINFFSKGKK